jgi:hypothetical protein
MRENEWQMQERLTLEWVKNGAQVGSERLFLAAWEVMTNWKINDSRKEWGSPSIDFLFLDRTGGIWLMEMKREVKHPKSAWEALCQVSYRVVALKRSFSFEALCSAHTDCWSGVHGRVSESAPQPLSITHQAFFQLPEALNHEQFGQGEWMRIVAAEQFHNNFSLTADLFSSSNEIENVKQAIKSKYPTWEKRLEFKRFVNDVTPDDWSSLLSRPTTWVLEQQNP